MQKQKQLYFIAVVCTEPLQTEITILKNYFLDNYNCKVALKSPPHITLIPPFELKEITEQNLVNLIEAFQDDATAFNIYLNGFGHFDKRTIFIQLNENTNLNRLQSLLQIYLIEKLKLLKTHAHFHPHVSIVNRDIKPEDFDWEWKNFKEKIFVGDFYCDAFALLKLVEGKWKVILQKQLKDQ